MNFRSLKFEVFVLKTMLCDLWKTQFQRSTKFEKWTYQSFSTWQQKQYSQLFLSDMREFDCSNNSLTHFKKFHHNHHCWPRRGFTTSQKCLSLANCDSKIFSCFVVDFKSFRELLKRTSYYFY